jgi:hypothetical protein
MDSQDRAARNLTRLRELIGACLPDRVAGDGLAGAGTTLGPVSAVRSACSRGFSEELRKSAFVSPLRLATRGLGGLLNPVSAATRKGLLAAGGAGADLGLRGAIYPMKMLSRYVMAGKTLRSQAVGEVLKGRTTVSEAMRISNQFDE